MASVVGHGRTTASAAHAPKVRTITRPTAFNAVQVNTPMTSRRVHAKTALQERLLREQETQAARPANQEPTKFLAVNAEYALPGDLRMLMRARPVKSAEKARSWPPVTIERSTIVLGIAKHAQSVRMLTGKVLVPA